MGTGASSALKADSATISPDDIKSWVSQLSEEERSKLLVAAISVASEDELTRTFEILQNRDFRKILAALPIKQEGDNLSASLAGSAGTSGSTSRAQRQDQYPAVAGHEAVSQMVNRNYDATAGTTFASLLESECVAILKLAYFEECLRLQEPVHHRAKIPPKWFFSGPEVLERWRQHGFGFLVVISYTWLSEHHPDPHLFHLPRLVGVLRALEEYHRSRCAGGSAYEIGVLIDWCSLWQGDERTPEQQRQFNAGLMEINTPYGHREVTAVKIIGTPKGELRGYDDRGWPLFESTLIDNKRPSLMDSSHGHRNVIAVDGATDLEGEVPEYSIRDIATIHRGAPLTPMRFEQELQKRQYRADSRGVHLFTKGSDQPFILQKYASAFNELVPAEHLLYSGLQWKDEEAQDLALVLPHCVGLRTLNLQDNSIGDCGMCVLISALPKCNTIEHFNLLHNPIDAATVMKMASVVPLCPSLRELHIGGIPGTNIIKQCLDQMRTLAAAWKDAGKDMNRLYTYPSRDVSLTI